MSEHPFRVTIPSSGSTDYLRSELERCLSLWFPEATVEAEDDDDPRNGLPTRASGA